MKTRLFITGPFALTFALAFSAHGADNVLGHATDWLGVSLFEGAVQARVSGLLDFEGYYFQQPPSGLIESPHNFLLNPRLTVNLDAQIGPHVYAFVETRVDRGFDPHDGGGQIRLDQYAVSLKPWLNSGWRIEVGKFATVVGNWSHRYDSWTNPFVNAPLPYENVTPIYDHEVPVSADDFLKQRFETGESYARSPVIWGPSDASGAALLGQIGKFDLAVEVKNASLSSRPETWDATQQTWRHPTWSGRFGWAPNPTWNFGFSASIGPYLRSGAALSDTGQYSTPLPAGKSAADYNESLLGQDISFAWRHWELWAECYETRFDVPRAGNVETLAYYLEAKYKFTPQLFGALRWNQQIYSSLRDDEGGSQPWGNDTMRLDAAVTYRFTPDLQAKLQYSIINQHLPGHEWQNFVGGQLTLRY